MKLDERLAAREAELNHQRRGSGWLRASVVLAVGLGAVAFTLMKQSAQKQQQSQAAAASPADSVPANELAVSSELGEAALIAGDEPATPAERLVHTFSRTTQVAIGTSSRPLSARSTEPRWSKGLRADDLEKGAGRQPSPQVFLPSPFSNSFPT